MTTMTEWPYCTDCAAGNHAPADSYGDCSCCRAELPKEDEE